MTMSVMETLSADNKVLRGFITYASLLMLKIVFVIFLTIYWRIRNKAAANPEDARNGRQVKVDDDVERVRRVFQNIIENEYLFFIFGFFYVLTGPNVYVALFLFRIYFVLRLIHTIFYGVYPIAPLRSLSFLLGTSILIYIVIVTFIRFIQF